MASGISHKKSEASPLAKKLFAFSYVKGVFITSNFEILTLDKSQLIVRLSIYEQRLERELSDDMKLQMEMKSVNPKYLVRNYIAQEVIEDVERGGNEKLKNWLEILYSPFAEHPEYESYSKPTPAEKKNYIVSCSS